MRFVGLLLATVLGSALVQSPPRIAAMEDPRPVGLNAIGPTAPPDGLIASKQRLQPRPAGPGDRWATGEILVRFRDEVSQTVARAIHEARGVELLGRVRVLGGVDVLRVDGERSIAQVLAAYRRDRRVAHAEPNLIRRLASHIPSSPAVPDDPLFPELWGIENRGQAHLVADPPPSAASGQALADMRVREAWNVEQGDSTTTVVAVIDSGVDITHPELSPNLWTNPGEVPGDGIDNDGNGFVDDVHGWNFASNNADLSDSVPHGTHVAGVIAAAANNATGVAGVCPHCRVMVLKVGGAQGFTLDALLGALNYARQMGAHIVNGSFGGGFWSSLERDAIRALGDAGILAVFAAGNESLDNDLFLADPLTGFFSPSFPASYDLPNILSVAASNHTDAYGFVTGCATVRPRWRCAFTNWGRESVDVAAPGTDIISTVPGGFEVGSGTSAAAPYAAGAAALVRSHRPDLSAEQVRNVLIRSADRPVAMRTMHSFLFRRERGRFTQSGGRVNVLAALTAEPGGGGRPSDGSIGGARRLSTLARGRVAYPGDVNDVYRKRLRKRATYQVVLKVPRGADLELRIWRPGTVEIWQMEIGCLVRGGGRCQLLRESLRGPGTNELIVFRPRRPGVHFFHVHAALSEAGQYALSVRRR